MGDTTAFLSETALHVWTIEPSPELASRARHRFATTANVTVVEGTSEDELQHVLDQVDGPLALWLAGHWSSGVTFLGDNETPIRQGLAVVEANLERFNNLTIFVDDIRLFDVPDSSGAYPHRTELVQWANRLGFNWGIELDILWMMRRKSQ